MTVGYWQSRYRQGLGSGPGSVGPIAEAKAERIHTALTACGGTSVLDLGCGGGQVAQLLEVPTYLGVEISDVALAQCIAATGRRPGWSWLLIDPYNPPRVDLTGDVAASFDVIFHLDDLALDWHLAALFGPTVRRALIRSTDHDAARKGHMQHHRWSHRIPPGWRVVVRPDGDGAGFWEVHR